MQIFVKMLTGSTITLDVELKSRVADVKCLPSTKNQLSHSTLAFGGKLLREDLTLLDYNIQHESTLHELSRSQRALQRPDQVFVKTPSGELFTLVLHSHDPVQTLKDQIEKKTGIRKRRQHLFHCGTRLMGFTLHNNSIRDNSTLELVEDIIIFVTIEGGKRHALNVTSKTTVLDVKLKIKALNGIAVHCQCLTYESKILNDRCSLSSCGISNLDVLHLKKKECDYYTICQQVRALLNLPDAYFDFESEYNKCYCKICHEDRNESYYYKDGEGDRIYTKPIGWGRIMLRLHPRAETLEVFHKWNVAYHGTTSSSVQAILDSGMLLLPGDLTIGGGKIQECVGHFNAWNKPGGFNTKQIFVSPSMKYAGCNVYAKKHRMHLPSCGPVDVRLAFQVRIHPTHLKVSHQTIGRIDQIDPPISNDEIEWTTMARDAVIPVALLVHVSPAETQPSTNSSILRAIRSGCAINYKPVMMATVQPV